MAIFLQITKAQPVLVKALYLALDIRRSTNFSFENRAISDVEYL